MACISVIIPVYNVEKYVRECLDSVRNQTFQDWECICIDDGSTDGSSAVCDEFAAADSRFHVVHQKNCGVSAARNRGQEQASGEWIWCVDADDCIHPRALELCRQSIVKNPETDFIYFDFIASEKPVFPEMSADVALQYGSVVPEMSAWRCIFKKELLNNLRFEDFIVGEDLLFCAKLSVQARQIGYLPLQLYGYVQRAGSVMHTPSFRQTMDSILWMAEVLRFYDGSGKKLYTHLIRSRWNKFFYLVPADMIRHKGNELQKLMQSWFDSLQKLSDIKRNCFFDFQRDLFLILSRISFFRPVLLYCNAMIFKLYLWQRRSR